MKSHVITFRPRDNTDEYAWESIPLERYRGTEIWAAFREEGRDQSEGSVFILDDLRIDVTLHGSGTQAGPSV